MKTMQVPVTFDGATPRKDKSVTFRLTSMHEITAEDFAEAYRVIGSQGWLTYTEGDKAPEDITVPDSMPSDSKSPSVRLKAVMYVWWQQGEREKPFDDFYRDKMESLITQIKEKLV